MTQHSSKALDQFLKGTLDLEVAAVEKTARMELKDIRLSAEEERQIKSATNAFGARLRKSAPVSDDGVAVSRGRIKVTLRKSVATTLDAPSTRTRSVTSSQDGSFGPSSFGFQPTLRKVDENKSQTGGTPDFKSGLKSSGAGNQAPRTSSEPSQQSFLNVLNKKNPPTVTVTTPTHSTTTPTPTTPTPTPNLTSATPILPITPRPTPTPPVSNPTTPEKFPTTPVVQTRTTFDIPQRGRAVTEGGANLLSPSPNKTPAITSTSSEPIIETVTEESLSTPHIDEETKRKIEEEEKRKENELRRLALEQKKAAAQSRLEALQKAKEKALIQREEAIKKEEEAKKQRLEAEKRASVMKTGMADPRKAALAAKRGSIKPAAPLQQKRFCTVCGSRLPAGGARFCTGCGSKVH